MTDYLFVYGTLRRDAANSMFHFLARYSDFQGDATYQGRLYKVDFYPGVVPSDKAGDVVYGEVYRLREPAILLEKLDVFEECGPQFPQPTEYERKKQIVRLQDGREIEAWVYLYNRPTAELERMPSGNFFNP